MAEKKQTSAKGEPVASKDRKAEPPSRPDIAAIELRRAREAKGLSHSDLHRITGISRSVLFGYEAGRTKPGAREIRLLCEALQVSPNKLLFGVEEPFKPRPGLRSFVKMRGSPMGVLAATFLIPLLFASLDDEQVESILILLESLVEARDKEAHRKIGIFVEMLGEEFGNGTPEDLARVAKKGEDPKFLEEIQRKIMERLAQEG